MVKTLRPSVWLTENFPLSVDEFLQLLDILANHVRVVRWLWLHELLTNKFPSGTFPVKVRATPPDRVNLIPYIKLFGVE
jgi:hypothetical protein